MKAEEAKALVDQGVQQLLEDPEQWRRWAATLSRFHRYSPGNVLLILSQRPDATYVAGYHAWQALGRQVQRGEHGITILAPVTRRPPPEAEAATDAEASAERARKAPVVVGFRAVTVFDVSQTAGRPLQIPEPQLLDGDTLAHLLPHLAQAVGVPVQFVPELAGGANGTYDTTARAIAVATAGRTADQQVKTLLHEWAHHAGNRGPGAVDPAPWLHRGAEEIAAETTAWVVAKRLGLDTRAYSLPYVGHWAQGDPAQVTAVMQEVATRVRAIADTLDQAAERDPLLAQAWPGALQAALAQEVEAEMG
ncbi:MAG: ssDNA-binding domain-containing protein [Firmicutes bacterium]|nr:ssDNA-binding domain-containing protein [Bacillota bacterium]